MSKTKKGFAGNSHFDMDNAMVNDTVMEKIRNRKLNLSAVKVYLYMARNRDLDTGRLNGNKISEIAEYWGMTTRSVRYAIQDLTEAGLYVPPNKNEIDNVEGTLLPKRKKGKK